MNVLEFAMQMEEDGQDYYRKLAAEATSPGLETIFNNLAKDERKHFEIFRQLRDGSRVDMADSSALTEARTLFAQLAGAPELTGLEQTVAAYRHGMQLEAKSFRLYQQAAEREPDVATRSLLLRIAAEEQKHFNILENICLFLEEPAQHPSWAEATELTDIWRFSVADE